MIFLIAAHSDVGIKKNTNQDSLLVKVAQTNLGQVCLCVVCDGMGGLSKGELASATVIRVFERWFETDFSNMTAKGFDREELKLQWDNLVLEQNRVLADYAARNGVRMGTTIASLLLIGSEYYVMNVGDSRVYLLNQNMDQLTKDQTFVQYELDAGRLTPEQAQNHPQRNVLLQCVGASEVVNPDFYYGKTFPDSMFLVCSDGFRHVIAPDEIYTRIDPRNLYDEHAMKDRLISLTELNKERHEVDNITAVLIRVCREE